MKKILFSGDIGNGYVKARTNAHEVTFQSVIAEESKSIDFQTAFNPNHSFVIEFEGKTYALGDTVHSLGHTPQSIAHRSRIETQYYRVLLAGALSATIQTSADVSAVLSLPPGAYIDKENLRAQIAGEYKVAIAGGKTYTYCLDPNNLRIVPEGLGGICYIALDEQGRSTEYADMFMGQTVGVIDVGTYTTDFLMFDRLKLQRRSTDSHPHGLNDIHTRIKQFASSHSVDLDDYELDNVLHQGFLKVRGKRVPISSEIESASSELASSIEAKMRTLWRGGDSAEIILLLGGGAVFVFKHLYDTLGDRLELIEHIPHFANCEGAYRYLLLNEQ